MSHFWVHSTAWSGEKGGEREGSDQGSAAEQEEGGNRTNGQELGLGLEVRLSDIFQELKRIAAFYSRFGQAMLGSFDNDNDVPDAVMSEEG